MKILMLFVLMVNFISGYEAFGKDAYTMLKNGLWNFVSYDKLKFELSEHHITQMESTDNKVIFYAEPDIGEENEADMVIEIQRLSDAKTTDMENVKKLFKDTGCTMIWKYEEIAGRNGVTQIYDGYSYEENESFFLVICNERRYCIRTNNRGLLWDLMGKPYGKRVQYYEEMVIQCAPNNDVKLISDINLEKVQAKYEIVYEKKNIRYMAVLEVNEDHFDNVYTLKVYDDKSQELQELRWISGSVPYTELKEYPEFADWNNDGYLDLMVMGDTKKASVAHTIFTWNADKQCFENVHYDGNLVEVAKKGNKDEYIQELSWSSMYEQEPVFCELNGDGYLDIRVQGNKSFYAEDLTLYIWNPMTMCYEQVEYEGRLVYIENRDGELWNWIRADKGSNVQRLVWEGNKLKLVEEEYVEPDE